MKKIPIQDKVKSILEVANHCKDDDKKLTANIWIDELCQFGVSREKAMEFCKLYISLDLTTSDTITRARRKLQETDPSLRGNSYINRKAREKEIRNKIARS